MPDSEAHGIDFDALDLAPDLSHLGPHALVPFAARRLKRARIVWINEGFWLGHGVDVTQPMERRALESWLLNTYAYCVPDTVADENLTGPEQLFYADRYGGSNGTTHGGSGRCGIRGRLNVKGIGRTPLVAADEVVNIQHSHGCVWLDEAIRETLAGEVCAAEYPHGAIPVVAVIDCGIHHEISEWGFVGHRALIVRPNFIRLAHLQRSTYFGTAGTPQSDQYLDAQRTRDAISSVWGADNRRDSLGIATESLAQSMERFADQIAFSYVHRFYFGGISSSNLAVDGQVVDFGAFTIVPTWARTIYNDELPRFGDEAASIRGLLQSLGFFQEKYLPEKEDIGQIANAVLARIFQSFGQYMIEALALGENVQAAAPLVNVFRQYFSLQQKRTDRLDGRLRKDWLYRALTADKPADTASLNGKVVLAIRRMLSQDGPLKHLSKKDMQAVYAGLQRWALPRPLLQQQRLIYRTRHLTDMAGDAEDLPQRVQALMDRFLSKSLRVWRHLPQGHVVVAQACQSFSCVVLCLVPKTGKHVAVLYGIAVNGRHFLFGQQWLPRTGAPSPVTLSDGRFALYVPVKGKMSAGDDVKAQTGINLPKLCAYEK